MPVALSKADLLATLQAVANAHGVTSPSREANALAGEAEVIGARWFLGARKVSYLMSCRLDDAAHSVFFRESVKESSWGVPPPTFSVEKTRQHGTRVSESRVDRSVGGGGTLEYGRLREAMEGAAFCLHWRVRPHRAGTCPRRD